MNVYVENNIEHNRWWVRLDDCRVSFTSSAEAEQFVERLLARLNAPTRSTSWPIAPRSGSAESRCAKEA